MADENRNGLMQATYAKTFRIGKSIIADTGNKTVNICSITGNGKGFNALCLLRSVYSAGESTLLSINAAYGGGVEYITINPFICSITGNGKGFNALCLLRSVYSAGESTLLSINAAYGGGVEYITINPFNTSSAYIKGMFKKKSRIGNGFDIYVELKTNVTFDIFFTTSNSVPLIFEETKDEGLIEI